MAWGREKKAAQIGGEQAQEVQDAAVQVEQPALVQETSKRIESRVSCLLCTKDRPEMFKRSIQCFAAQTYQDRELVIVDSGEAPVQPPEGAIYQKVDPSTLLGAALNLAASLSTGAILQKWDDDDVYGPEFLVLSAGNFANPGTTISVWGDYLVELNGKLRLASGIMAGGTIAARAAVWEQVKFQEIPARVDAAFLQNVITAYGIGAVAAVKGHPDQYTYTRHGANIWQTITMYNATGQANIPIDQVFARMPLWTKQQQAKGQQVKEAYRAGTR